MHDSSPPELELTSDLLEYAKKVALKEARKRCPQYIDCDDVAQDALLHLISKPPRYDPVRGAKPKTLIYTIIQRAVLKYIGRECKHAGRFVQMTEPTTVLDTDEEGVGKGAHAEPKMHRAADLRSSGFTTDDVLEFIDNEDSRALCRLVMECKGNVSEAARRMKLSEGTVRYRLKLLAPKLLAAGFNPFSSGDVS